MAAQFTYTEAFDGERWDQVAQRAYGSAELAHLIWRANPEVGIVDRLDGGTVIKVPVLEAKPVETAEAVPPWKR